MPYSFKQLLKEAAGEAAPGPSPSFSVFHLLRAIELAAKQPIGRGKLAEGLGVGEGAVRTIIGRLRDAELIAVSKAGCALTKKGLGLWKEYQMAIEKTGIGKSELTKADCNCAVLVREVGHKLKSGMEQRDAAVMAGGRSATAAVLREDV